MQMVELSGTGIKVHLLKGLTKSLFRIMSQTKRGRYVERQIEKENSETQKIPEDETTPKFNSQAGLSSSTIVFETNKTPEDKTPPISKDSQAGPSSSTIVSETHETPEDKAPPISNSQAGPSSSTILSEVSPNTFNKSLEEICTLPKNSEVSGNTKKRHQL
ncbi:hypothetical protein JTB14_035860 [Gonioctena quinquepunctata]|nr:hypothetical protein JTB14_035860 [Gonioctena quinquepunctata]